MQEAIDRPEKMYLISDFGEDARPDFVTQEVLDEWFVKSERAGTMSGKLLNGWEQYERRTDNG